MHSKSKSDTRKNHHATKVKASLFTARIALAVLRADIDRLSKERAINHDEWEAIALPLAEAHRQLENAAKVR